MKILNKMVKFVALLLVVLIQFIFIPVREVYAATDPGLGAAASFSVLAQTSITGISTISGDVGINSTGVGITALTAGNVGGTIYSTDGTGPSVATPFLSPTVQADALAAYTTNIPGQGATGSIGPALDALIVTPGVYDIGAGRLNGGVLHLDGQGIYIFRASSDFISSGSISLENGARACDVFWRVETLATINGSSFVGTILAGTGIHFGKDVTLNGRALAIGGDVTMISDTITGPTCEAAATPPPLVCSGTQHLNAGSTQCVDYSVPDSGQPSGGTTSTGQVLGASTLAATGDVNSKVGILLMILGSALTLGSLYAFKKSSF
jgi:hypothetical protein